MASRVCAGMFQARPNDNGKLLNTLQPRVRRLEISIAKHEGILQNRAQEDRENQRDLHALQKSIKTDNRVAQSRLSTKVDDKISKALRDFIASNAEIKKEFTDSKAEIKRELKTLQTDVNNLNAEARAAQNWIKPIVTNGPIVLACWGAFRNVSIKVLDQNWVLFGFMAVVIFLYQRFLKTETSSASVRNKSQTVTSDAQIS